MDQVLNRYRSYTRTYWGGYTPTAYGWTDRTSYRLNGLGTKLLVRAKFTAGERPDADALARDICGKHWVVLVDAYQEGIEGFDGFEGVEVEDRDGDHLVSCP